MCVAVPGKVVSIEGNFAHVDFKGNTVRVNTGLVAPDVGDFVLVHAGCAIEIVSSDMASELAEMFDELSEVANKRT